MGIYYRLESSLEPVRSARVSAREPMWPGTSKDEHADLIAGGDQFCEEWIQPQSSGDAQQRIMALYDEYRPRLYRYLRSMNLRRDWAEEIIQETFMRLTAKLLKADDIENVQGWIVRVAHNLGVDVLKKERSSIPTDEGTSSLITNRADPALSPEEAYLRNERFKKLNAAVLALKPQHRQCFQMRAHGFRYKDIGVALGISEQRAALIVKQVAVRLAAMGE